MDFSYILIAILSILLGVHIIILQKVKKHKGETLGTIFVDYTNDFYDKPEIYLHLNENGLDILQKSKVVSFNVNKINSRN